MHLLDFAEPDLFDGNHLTRLRIGGSDLRAKGSARRSFYAPSDTFTVQT